jgi:hypothetical protein
MRRNQARKLIFIGLILLLLSPLAQAQRTAWRQATDAELASLLPARAQVVTEHIETEMRTASGIVNGRGQFIAGVVLITAGYSAADKYSHYLILQAPVSIGGVALKPGKYVLGWVRTGDALIVRLYEAASGTPVGTTEAHRIAGSSRKALIQIGRFGIPYQLGEK